LDFPGQKSVKEFIAAQIKEGKIHFDSAEATYKFWTLRVCLENFQSKKFAHVHIED